MKATITCLFILSVISSGCKKLVELDAPKTEVLSTSVFSTDASAQSVITGTYANMINLQAFPYIGYYSSLSADETDPTNTSYLYINFANNTLTPSDYNIPGLWTGLYKTIYQANSIIEGAAVSTGMSDSIKVRLTGEAKFLRALSHFYLVSFFGDVPLITSTDVKVNATMARTATATVYQQIIADLLEAENALPEDYSYYSNERDRPNKYAAAAFLARVYLYTDDYTNAEKQATIALGSSLYSLLQGDDISNIFLKESEESMFALNPATATGQVIFSDAYYYGNGLQYGSLYGSNYVLTDSLVNAFESGDLRYSHWIDSFVYNGTTYYYSTKYKDYNYSQQPTEYSVMFRLSEQYLIRAEARAQLNDLSNAASDLDVIRNRAGLANTTAGTQASLLTAILKERRVELFLEYGHRWLDLKRTGLANTVMAAAKPATWTSTAVLYPVPIDEIESNPALTQNPGY
ncbi:RagB/SusD family nutrient uptake outer membrane protein [Chitinophaga sancti]|uniref:RagB/SusD family nutrient uptake outer membrane protein n=1 Tax=Chitinophaga sancti TaxID=1004 RepID=UPI002A766CBA|nr:RagB/SusD family nutrient uptake outer membrane protein [Chitinophaga sancti]WPQ66184.1 RagB/SusD family nutrient uptake outer membrane protein [Chitinophaga sancti]